jgi:hypothetical protein
VKNLKPTSSKSNNNGESHEEKKPNVIKDLAATGLKAKKKKKEVKSVFVEPSPKPVKPKADSKPVSIKDMYVTGVDGVEKVECDKPVFKNSEHKPAERKRIHKVTDNNFTDSAKTKLDGIEDGAQVNVQSDWAADEGPSSILNQPNIISNHKDLILDDGTNPHKTTKTDVGLSNVDNTSDKDKPLSLEAIKALEEKENAFYKSSAFNKDFGKTEGTVSEGNHRHDGIYEIADGSILKKKDIGVTVQEYNSDTVIDANYVATENNFTTYYKTKIISLINSVQSLYNSLVSTFLGLTDTPNNYTGEGGKIVAVKGDETGVEFITPTAGVTNHSALILDDGNNPHNTDTADIPATTLSDDFLAIYILAKNT